MNALQKWLKAHKFAAHSIIFIGMVVASALLYFAAAAGSAALIGLLIGVFAIANLFALLV